MKKNLLFILLLICIASVYAQGDGYTAATEGNTFNTTDDSNTSWWATHNASDGLWGPRAEKMHYGDYGAPWEGSTAEDAPLIYTVIEGLEPYKEYYVDIVFGGKDDWGIKAGLSSSGMEYFNVSGNTVNDFTAMKGIKLLDTSSEDLYYGRLPIMATADLDGEIKVYIDDIGETSNLNARTWYCGINVTMVDENIIVSPKELIFDGKETKDVVVTGEVLTDDISITAPQGFTVEPSLLSSQVKNQVVQVTFDGESATGEITFVSGSATAIVNVTGTRLAKLDELVVNGNTINPIINGDHVSFDILLPAGVTVADLASLISYSIADEGTSEISYPSTLPGVATIVVTSVDEQTSKTYYLNLTVRAAGGTTGQYYVSPSGADSNSGSLLQPFKTIQRAASVMVAGDVCFIREGVYNEKVTPINNGTESKPIVFKNYEGENAVIMGTDTITRWEVWKDGIFKAYVPAEVSQLMVDKSLAFKARYPTFKGDHLSTSDWASVSVNDNKEATFSGASFATDYWKGATVNVLVGSRWIAHNGKVVSNTGQTLKCTDTSWPWGYNYSTGIYAGNGVGCITDHINALDDENEWHWENDTLYYYPKAGTDINTSAIVARTRNNGFEANGNEHVNIKGLNFVMANVNFEEAQNCTIDSVSVLYPTPFFFYTSGWTRQSEHQENYSVSHWEGKGVTLSGKNNTLKNSYIAHSWGDGVSVGGQYNTVENCLIEDCDWSATDCAPLTTVGADHAITGNTMRNTARSILVNRLTYTTDITYNHLYNCGFITNDLGATYSYKSNGKGSHIAYNWVHSNKASHYSIGIYLDNYDTAYVVHHNVVWDCYEGLRTNTPGRDFEVYNNTVWFCSVGMGSGGPSGATLENQVVRNNLSNKAFDKGNTFSNNLQVSSSPFTDASLYDFTLSPIAPAIDYGVDITGITDGYKGSAPDAGAYEYGADVWVPGTSTIMPDLSEVVNIVGLPETPKVLSGRFNITDSLEIATYVVEPIEGATSYEWTLPNGLSGTSTSNRIEVTIDPNFSKGSISVKGINRNGEGVAITREIINDSKPQLAFSQEYLTFDELEGNSEVAFTVVGANLEDDISITVPNGFSVDTTSISKGDDGRASATITVTFDGVEEVRDYIVFKTGELTERVRVIGYIASNYYTPLYPEGNLIVDPYLSVKTPNFTGWGGGKITTDTLLIYGGSRTYHADGTAVCWPNGATLDYDLPKAFEANAYYRLRAMIKTMDGTFAFEIKGADIEGSGTSSDGHPLKAYNMDTYGVWEQYDTIFVTGANPTTAKGIFFNNCGGSTGTQAFLDNYELYKIPFYVPTKELVFTELGQDGFTVYAQMEESDEDIVITAPEGITLSTSTVASDAGETIITVGYTGGVVDDYIYLTSGVIMDSVKVTGDVSTSLVRNEAALFELVYVDNDNIKVLFEVGERRGMTFYLYNIQGTLIERKNAIYDSGRHTLVFDEGGRDGVYLVKILKGDKVSTHKLVKK